MRFLRKSITTKAAAVFSITSIIVFSASIILKKKSIEVVPINIFLILLIVFAFIYLTLFILFIAVPINKILKEVKALLTGKDYHRIPPFSIDELGVFTHFFNEVTLNLEKVSFDLKERRRLSSEIDIARQIQSEVLPKKAPEVMGLDIVAKTKSAAEIGGDSFDFLQSKDNTFIYTGDVTGHGVPSGLIMMMVDTLLSTFVMQKKSAEEIIVNTNYILTPRIASNLFMTLALLRWDQISQKMYFTGAGHEHILLYNSSARKCEAIKTGGIAIGMIHDISKIVKEQELSFNVNDVIVLYTDGITEAKNQEGTMYGLEKLRRAVERNGFRSTAEGIFDYITKDFQEFVGEYVQKDDITMIVIKNIGKESQKNVIKLGINIDTQAKALQKKVWSWN